eukprot:2813835-Rhodomonas_salina.2
MYVFSQLTGVEEQVSVYNDEVTVVFKVLVRWAEQHDLTQILYLSTAQQLGHTLSQYCTSSRMCVGHTLSQYRTSRSTRVGR